MGRVIIIIYFASSFLSWFHPNYVIVVLISSASSFIFILTFLIIVLNMSSSLFLVKPLVRDTVGQISDQNVVDALFSIHGRVGNWQEGFQRILRERKDWRIQLVGKDWNLKFFSARLVWSLNTQWAQMQGRCTSMFKFFSLENLSLVN